MAGWQGCAVNWRKGLREWGGREPLRGREGGGRRRGTGEKEAGEVGGRGGGEGSGVGVKWLVGKGERAEQGWEEEWKRETGGGVV